MMGDHYSKKNADERLLLLPTVRTGSKVTFFVWAGSDSLVSVVVYSPTSFCHGVRTISFGIRDGERN